MRLADGRKFKVGSAESVAIPPRGKTVAVAMPDGTFDFVDLAQVASIKVKSAGLTRKREAQP